MNMGVKHSLSFILSISSRRYLTFFSARFIVKIFSREKVRAKPSPSRFRTSPEGTDPADFLHGLSHFPGIVEHMRDIVRIHAFRKIRPRKQLDHVRDGDDAFIGAFDK